MRDVIVVGGGIAGLGAAYTLLKESQDVRVTLLEAADYWGGKITTERVDGFVIEGGPDTFLATKPWAVKLCRELGIADRLQGTNPDHKQTYVLREGELEPLPEGLTMMIPTQFMPMIRTGLLTWPEKFRMGLDFFLPAAPPNGDESLGNFVSRRLGRAAYERLIEPLMSGIYAGDGDKLSLQSTFPYLREMEMENGGLVKGALVKRREIAQRRAEAAAKAGQPANGANRTPGNRSIFLTPQTGLAEIVEALVDWLTDREAELRLQAPVRAVRRSGAGYEIELESGEHLAAGGLILATPAYVSGRLLEGLDPNLAKTLASIEYVSTATISLAYRQEDLPQPLDGYGYVIPRREGRRALACTWTSTKFPHRAPQDFALVRVFAGRAGLDDDLPEDEAGLVELAREELRLTLGVTAEPALQRVTYWDRAMPQYNLGHPARLKQIEAALERIPGLALAGNGYEGIGIPDCIHSGEQAACRIVATSLEKAG